MLLGKLKARAQRHVRGIEPQEWTAVSFQEITVSFAPKKMLAVEFRRHVAAIEIGRSQPSPVQRRTHPPHQLALNILIEKFVLKISKDAVAIERVIGGRKTAARYGGNVIHLIQQASVLALPGNLGARQLFQDAIGQGGSPCPTAGECQKYLQAVRISGVGEISETIAALWIVMLQSRILHIMSAAGSQQHDRAEYECEVNSHSLVVTMVSLIFPYTHRHATAQRFVNSNQGRDGARLAGGETVLCFKEGAFGV